MYVHVDVHIYMYTYIYIYIYIYISKCADNLLHTHDFFRNFSPALQDITKTMLLIIETRCILSNSNIIMLTYPNSMYIYYTNSL